MDYPFSEFWKDYQAVEALLKKTGKGGPEMARLHFSLSSDPKRKGKEWVFVETMMYVDLNMSAFDEAPFAVAGKKESAIHIAVFEVIHAFFRVADELGFPPPPLPPQFKNLAKKPNCTTTGLSHCVAIAMY